jgi:hypothetical protein
MPTPFKTQKKPGVNPGVREWYTGNIEETRRENQEKSLYYPFLIAPSFFSNVSSVFVLSILDCPFGFHQRLLTINLIKIFNGKSHHEKRFF